MKRSDLLSYLDELLQPSEFSDYGPNGLQVEGREEIKHIAFAVSATKESILKASAMKADCLLTHHGVIWKHHGGRALTGYMANRLRPLFKTDVNLISYHLPLDAHLEVGNAACLAQMLGMENLEPFSKYKKSYIGVKGTFKKEITGSKLKEKLQEILNHDVIHSNPETKIKTLGIVTGGANNNWVDALEDGLDAYLTGEMSEHNWNEAKEAGLHMFAGGHYATELFGIKKLQELIEKKFKVKTTFIKSSNPV